MLSKGLVLCGCKGAGLSKQRFGLVWCCVKCNGRVQGLGAWFGAVVGAKQTSKARMLSKG